MYVCMYVCTTAHKEGCTFSLLREGMLCFSVCALVCGMYLVTINI